MPSETKRYEEEVKASLEKYFQNLGEKVQVENQWIRFRRERALHPHTEKPCQNTQPTKLVDVFFLDNLLLGDFVHYTDIKKKAVATYLRFSTSNTIRKQFYHYLLPNGYIERVSRGVYKITPKGEKLFEILR